MNKRVKLKILGSGETDAPTVQDFLCQLRDFFEILKGVEEAIASDAKAVIEWRIVSASMNSPICIEVEAYSRTFGVNIDRRVDAVVKTTSAGLRQLRVSPQRPPHFTDAVLQRTESFAERITNGLANTIIEYGFDEPSIEINRDAARLLGRKVDAILNPTPKAYRELGSIEGFFKGVEEDGYNRPLVWIRHRISGSDVKCLVFDDHLRSKIGAEQIGEVWNQRRLLVMGMIYYKALAKVDYVEATDFRILRKNKDLPSVDEIQDDAFTNGIRSEEYLEKVWNGEIH